LTSRCTYRALKLECTRKATFTRLAS